MLCLHTLRADCNQRAFLRQTLGDGFASRRSVQIATVIARSDNRPATLCLHTLRADCNRWLPPLIVSIANFASTRSVQIATTPQLWYSSGRDCFASTRSVQIATRVMRVISVL